MKTTTETAETGAAPEPKPGRGPLVITAGLGALFLVGCWAAWFFTIDDAFITFRYSANMADGHGPVWNVGEDPIEGFTNFLWMLWHVPFALAGLPLETVAKVTSVVLGAGILVMLVRAGHRAAGVLGALVAAGALVLFVPTYFHVTAGLETIAFAAVVLRAAIVGVDLVQGRAVRDWEPPLLLLLAGMIRPEGVLATLPGFLVWCWLRRRQGRTWALVAAVVVVGGGYFGWRWSYFGHLFPNTFYVKFGNLDAGSVWLETTALLFLPLLILAASLLIRKASRGAGLVLCSVVLLTGMTYAVSGPTMDYLYRFAFHAFPVLCLGAGLAMAHLGRRWIAALAGTVAVGWVAVAGATSAELPLTANYGPDLQRAHVAIGKGLAAARVPEAARRLAVSDAGAIPYYSGWKAIDYIGLNDEAIAHGAEPTDVVKAARPTVIVVTAFGPGAIPGVAYRMKVPEVAKDYEFVADVQMRDGYYQEIFVLPEYAAQVKAAVSASVDEAQRRNDPGRYEGTIDRWLDRLRGQLQGG
ncbi:hypothetical protein [Amycolatopsis alba]|uniref:Glycosyltransferase RgtA/B/C/D-like domain-containing protein n=1 Tax=Amycolatopsis alba DSM 44262 TaxID=1125972 RepID=A0A229S0G9_AMYAL|nr:hypothetical protein [Amycolatopsis alba]OXM52423.1 hypothetical protein CFP75_09575 [Amycolatopsis alba DSM 44262]